jgi:hypothetical protein
MFYDEAKRRLVRSGADFGFWDRCEAPMHSCKGLALQFSSEHLPS